VSTVGSLAGCNQLTDGTNDDNGNDETATSNPDISVSISRESEPDKLPSIWTDHSVEDYQAEFAVETSGAPEQVTITNGEVELDRDSKQWNGNSVTVQPGQMNSGEQEFTAIVRKSGATAEDTTQASKPTPGNYKVDVVPQRNEELRNTIQQESDEEDYLEARGNFTEQDPVFSSYSSHEAVRFDKLGIDLVAQEWRHDNDYHDIGRPADTNQFLESIGSDTGNSEIKAIKNGEGTTWYPNGNFEEREVGSFDYEKFANAETLGEALGPLHSYYFNWQSEMTETGPISSEDDIYAVTLEQAIEQKNNKDLEAHAWDFDLDEHGNGLIYGKNADGSDELRIMETVANPITASAKNVHDQLHPLVEDSNYLNPDHGEFNRYWHPLRFGWEEHNNSTRWDFQGEKTRAEAVMFNMAGSMDGYPKESWEGLAESTVATTTGYLKDFTEKLRTYNENDADFEDLKNQSKVFKKMINDTENNHVVYGDTKNPQYAVVEDESVIEDIWEDEEGQYDDFNQFLRNNPSYSMSTEEVNAELEGEETEAFGQQTLAGT